MPLYQTPHPCSFTKSDIHAPYQIPHPCFLVNSHMHAPWPTRAACGRVLSSRVPAPRTTTPCANTIRSSERAALIHNPMFRAHTTTPHTLNPLVPRVERGQHVRQHRGVLPARHAHRDAIATPEHAAADDGFVHLVLKGAVEAAATDLLKRLRTPQSRARLAADAAKPRRRRHGGRLARDWLMLALQAGRKLRTLHTPAAAPLAAHSIAGYPLAPLSSGRDRRCRRGSSRYSLLQSTLPELRQPGAAWDAPRLRGSSARGRGRSSPPLELRLEPPLPNGLSLSVPPGQPSACRARRSAPSAKLRVLIRRSVYARETSPGWLAFGARRNAGSMRCISSCAVRRHAHPRLVWASITSFRCCTCRNLSGTYR
mmetsp:Transcript_4763/g.14416  ORF Transcript_4763/g.14416 Transcript_4763/m.14416 type:complete len:369 (+) Transcript_4763:367-1473(+)